MIEDGFEFKASDDYGSGGSGNSFVVAIRDELYFLGPDGRAGDPLEDGEPTGVGSGSAEGIAAAMAYLDMGLDDPREVAIRAIEIAKRLDRGTGGRTYVAEFDPATGVVVGDWGPKRVDCPAWRSTPWKSSRMAGPG